MKKMRSDLLQKVFNSIDKKKKGFLTLDQILEAYNVNKSPAFISGQKTRDEVLKEFKRSLKQFLEKKNTQKFTYELFSGYYSTISAEINDDDEFEQ